MKEREKGSWEGEKTRKEWNTRGGMMKAGREKKKRECGEMPKKERLKKTREGYRKEEEGGDKKGRGRREKGS